MTVINLVDTKVKRKLSLVLGAASLAFLMQAPVWAAEESTEVSKDEAVSRSLGTLRKQFKGVGGKRLMKSSETTDEDIYTTMPDALEAHGKSIEAQQERYNDLQMTYKRIITKISAADFSDMVELQKAIGKFATDMVDAGRDPGEFVGEDNFITFLQELKAEADAVDDEPKFNKFKEDVLGKKDDATVKLNTTFYTNFAKEPEEKLKTFGKLGDDLEKALRNANRKVRRDEQTERRRLRKEEADRKIEETKKALNTIRINLVAVGDTATGGGISKFDTIDAILSGTLQNAKFQAHPLFGPLEKPILLIQAVTQSGMATTPVFSAIGEATDAIVAIIRAAIAGKPDSEVQALGQPLSEAVQKMNHVVELERKKAAEGSRKEAESKSRVEAKKFDPKTPGGKKDTDDANPKKRGRK